MDTSNIPTPHAHALPCASCGERGPDRHDRPGVPWRASGKRYGIDGPICKRCYDQRRQHSRRQGSEWTRNAVQDEHARDLGRQLHADLGLRCCEPGEFATWMTMALQAQSHGEGTADFDGYCGDAPESWCAMATLAGRCIRHRQEALAAS